MRVYVVICFVLITSSLRAQQLINNKGNRMQTYPQVTEINPDVQALVGQVSISNLEDKIRWMQNIGIRQAESPVALTVQNWLVDQFEDFGLDVYIHYFPCEYPPSNGDTLDAGNVVAIQRGTEFPDEYIVVSSHYDHPDGPGADDNASGTSGVLEIARILSQHQFKRSIMYIPFNAEEYWMVGSLPFVEQCAQEDMNILACFNLDMLGFFPESMGALTMSSGASPISERLWSYYETVANIYVPDILTFRFTVGDSYGGDHMPFNMYQYPALYIGDVEYHHGYNNCYHRPCDTLGAGVNSMELVRGFTKAALAATVELANGWLAPQNLSAVPVDKKITVSWDAAPKTQKYRLFKNNVFVTETTETSYEDTEATNGTENVYYVTGIHAETQQESPESNRDTIAASLPLTLPYFCDFETNKKDWRANNQNWKRVQLKAYSGKSSLTNNTTTSGALSDNLLTLAEWNWFSIPDTATNVTLSFWMQGRINSNWKATIGCVEATTDRKHWGKLKVFPMTFPEWTFFQLPLNEYIGEDFVQVRFRIESSGEKRQGAIRQIFIDDFSINFTAAQPLPPPQNVRIVSYSAPMHRARIEWDKAALSVQGYNIYRDGVKINDEIVSLAVFVDNDATSSDFCYQVTAIFPDRESAFSEKVCIDDVGIENIPIASVCIAPNPTTGMTTIETGLLNPYAVSVYNLQGILVFRKDAFADGILDLSHLPKGVYLLRVEIEKQAVARKIVIQ